MSTYKDKHPFESRLAESTNIIQKHYDRVPVIVEKDKHSKMGLNKSVNRRKKLLAYLKRRNPDSYNKVLKQLNLRK